ncbi:MAG: 50S ribosomal protein L18 [archaeon]
MKGKPKIIQYRRKREGKTDYRLRLKLVASEKPRLTIRRTNKHMIVQIIQFHPDGDKILAGAAATELKKYGWKAHTKNLPAAYLVGLLCGVKAKKAKVKEAITDLGLNKSSKGGVLYAALKGAIDAGLDIHHSEEILPPKDRLTGKHIADYAKAISSDKAKYEKQFSKYIKANVKPEEIEKQFETTKSKILKEKQ